MEAVKKAIDIISEQKTNDQTAEGTLKDILTKASTAPDDVKDSIKDHIKKAVEETVKQEVANISCSSNVTITPPMSAEEKKEIVKTKKI